MELEEDFFEEHLDELHKDGKIFYSTNTGFEYKILNPSVFAYGQGFRMSIAHSNALINLKKQYLNNENEILVDVRISFSNTTSVVGVATGYIDQYGGDEYSGNVKSDTHHFALATGVVAKKL